MAPSNFTQRTMKFKNFGGLKVWTTTQDPGRPARWTANEDRAHRRIRKWRAKHSWCDAKAERFGCSRAYMELDPDEDAAWECVDLLGQGAFGTVGKFYKFNKDREVVDTLAIKEFDFEHWDADPDGNPGVPGEVAIAKALENEGCQRIARIRRMRFFNVGRPKFRLYLQYYSHGTLADMIDEYLRQSQIEKRRVYMPEGFIWQALNDFAEVYKHMKSFRLRSLNLEGRGAAKAEEYFVLHLDIKPPNVLLGDGPSDRKLMPYPTLKVADWGLAECTNRWDSKNSYKWKRNGTICFMPPEQYDNNRYGQNWRRNVMGDTNRAYTPKHSLWQMAACIYGMMELDKNNKRLETELRAAERHEHRLVDNGYSLLPSYRHPRYSSELCSLVEDCLRIRPESRPSPDELIRRIERGMQPFLKYYARTGEYEPVLVTGADGAVN